MTAFEEMGVMPELGKSVEDMDWMLPTDVQSEAIPMILGGGDVLMAAETGSGKTGAFCLPIIQIVHESLKDQAEGKGKGKTISKASDTSKTWKMNVFDRSDAMAIDPEGHLCQARDPSGWHGVRSNKSVFGKDGRFFYEATVTDEGLCRVGWSTNKATLDLGTDKFGFGFGGTGKKSFGRQFDSYGESFGINDVIGCYLDLEKGIIKWSKNGIDLGKAYDIPGQIRNEKFFAALVLKNAEMEINFGDNSFKYPPDKSWTPLFRAPKEYVFVSRVDTGANTHKPAPNAPQAIIIEPSRELAEQTFTQIVKFKKHMSEPNLRELLIIGGVSSKDQCDKLEQGVDIVVGTPGRMDDLISSGKLALHQVRFFVLDEADGLLSQGYGELINRLHQQIPKVTNDGNRLQMIVCSATLHSFDVKKMAERLMYFPTWIDLKGQDSVPETVHHVVCEVDPNVDTQWKNMKFHIQTDGVHYKDNHSNLSSPEMMSEAVKILKGEYTINAIEEHNIDRGLIFCRTKLDCDNMEKYLMDRGRGKYSCVCLHSDRKPPERKANLQKFKDKKVRFLICTDVAARGIDVTGLPFVINVTLPDEKQNYIHRIGRVGRAERMGLAISLVSLKKEKVWYHSNCNSRGKGCYNTNLTDRGGCCIWYDEPKLLNDIQEHLDITIDKVQPDMKIPVFEFDGKVTYGQKRKNTGSTYKGHVAQLAPTVSELSILEKRVQSSFIDLKYNRKFASR
ncbi:ATP-dependent RNA helicase DDX1-like [Argonauta hians]